MPLLGARTSIAGGLHKAVEAAAAVDMETVPFFAHRPSQWAVKPVSTAVKGSLRDGESLTSSQAVFGQTQADLLAARFDVHW